LEKAPDAFRTISEVAEEINVPRHVLRFWESRFTQIRPLKRGGGRRYYRPDDVDLLRGVRHLLYGEGYTIRGVQRILREEGLSFVQEVWRPGAELPAAEDEGDADVVVSADNEVPRGDREPLFDVAPVREQPPVERREPTLVPPAVMTQPAPSPRAVANADDRRRLQSVLDDLVAARALIDDALAADPFAEGQAAEAE
jgi:DNA-binding transcriptional MerR regulator